MSIYIFKFSIFDSRFLKMDFIDIKQDYNPWAATSIFDFMFFCCPECDCKSPNKQDFVNHTVNYHSWVSWNL